MKEEEEERRVYCYFTFLHTVVISIISRYLYLIINLVLNYLNYLKFSWSFRKHVVRLQTPASLVRGCENTLNIRYWYNAYV